MHSIFRFKGRYFIVALIIFFIEIFIALFAHDRFVRPYAGDFLVVILIYCFLRAFLDIQVIKLAIFTLLFAYLIEVLQYLNLLSKLGLQHSGFAKTVLGSSFEWADLAAYTLGIAFVLYLERRISRKDSQRSMPGAPAG